MENYNRIESFDHHNIIKRNSSNELNLIKNKDELIMDCANNESNSQSVQTSILAGGKGAANTNSPKMGLRRIFTPQFKLQVLESYRSDHDCKGNQRATARKYNIHRRQIQKWLQCEPSLRSSVANINQNAVKHQFHNVSMQQQEQTKNVVIASQSSVNNLSHATSQLHPAHLCLDSHKIIEVPPPLPPLSSCVSIPTTQEQLGTTTTVNSSTPAVVSPLRPSAVISTNRNTNASMSPLLHHHHYGIPAYANISPTATVPILVHHLTNSPQTPYLYHNMSYTTAPTLSHHETEKQHTPYFPPTLFLPAAATSTSKLTYTSGNNEHHVDKLDLFAVGTEMYPKILAEKSFLFNNNHFHVNYECREASNNRDTNSSNALESSFTVNQFNGDSPYSTAYPYAPMDLSLRHNRETKSELQASVKTQLQTHMQKHEIPIKKESADNGGGPNVVDLTYNHRKRSIFSTQQSGSNYDYEYPEKQQKLSSNTDAQPDKLVTYNTSEIGATSNAATENPSKTIEDDDIEIEVGVEEKVFSATKPVKLFKPYLLDDCENNSDNNCRLSTSNTNKSSKSEKNVETEQIAKQADDVCTNENTFPDALKENINICIDSSNFLIESRSESPRSICSTAAYIPTMSPTNFKYSKGSPASSGYESSTSTYSDTSLSSKNDTYTYGQTYSVNLQMQAIYHKNIHATNAAYPSKHVQRWLEKDDFNSLENSPTIALFV